MRFDCFLAVLLLKSLVRNKSEVEVSVVQSLLKRCGGRDGWGGGVRDQAYWRVDGKL